MEKLPIVDSDYDDEEPDPQTPTLKIQVSHDEYFKKLNEFT